MVVWAGLAPLLDIVTVCEMRMQLSTRHETIFPCILPVRLTVVGNAKRFFFVGWLPLCLVHGTK